MGWKSSAGTRDLSFFPSVHTGCGTHHAYSLMENGIFPRKWVTKPGSEAFYRVFELGISGAMPSQLAEGQPAFTLPWRTWAACGIAAWKRRFGETHCSISVQCVLRVIWMITVVCRVKLKISRDCQDDGPVYIATSGAFPVETVHSSEFPFCVFNVCSTCTLLCL